jgi:hypothetical protein
MQNGINVLASTLQILRLLFGLLEFGLAGKVSKR